MSVTSDNNLVLTFDEPLGVPLSSTDIVSLDITGSRSTGYKFSVKLSKIDETSYEINIDFTHTDIPSGTKVTLVLSDSLSDAANNFITTMTLSGELNKVEVETDPIVEAQEEQAEALGQATEGTSQASMSASMAASAATGDFGAAWNMLNTL